MAETIYIALRIPFIVGLLIFILFQHRRNKAFRDFSQRRKKILTDQLTWRIDEITDLYLPKPGTLMTEDLREKTQRAIATDVVEVFHLHRVVCD
jgi:hypothetical protein